MSDAEYLKRRGTRWHYRRRVPLAVRALDGRDVVQIPTGQTSLASAAQVRDRLNAELEAWWDALAQGGVAATADDRTRYEAAVRRATALGLPYRPLDALAEGDGADLLARLAILEQRGLDASRAAAAGALGTVRPPVLRLSELPERFFAISRDLVSGKSDDQAHRWRLPRLRAVTNAVAVIGDKPLSDITRADAVAFRAWWTKRVEAGMDAGSANKDFAHLSGMWSRLDDTLQLGLGRPFARLRLAGEERNVRAAFSPAWVRDRLLAPGALDGMHPECQAIVPLMALTGARLSEIINREPDDIVTDAPIPHMRICARPGRRLKTRWSERDVPLVPGAVLAWERVGRRFDHYAGRANGLSATVNKALAVRGLREGEGTTLYSLRHTFQDLLIEADVPERVQAELMGHVTARERYGKGATLERKKVWLEKALAPVVG